MNKSIATKSAVFAIALCGLTAGQRASAITLVENLSNPSGGFTNITGNTMASSPFVTGNTSYNLTSVILQLERVSTSTTGFSVSLYSDISNQPGAPLSVFTNPGTLPSSAAATTFSLATPQLLSANTKYWVVASLASGQSDQANWDYTPTLSFTGLPGWSIPNEYIISNNGGTTWGGIISGVASQQFSLDGSPASAPSTPAVPGPLPILGAAACWRFSRKLRAATKAHR